MKNKTLREYEVDDIRSMVVLPQNQIRSYLSLNKKINKSNAKDNALLKLNFKIMYLTHFSFHSKELQQFPNVQRLST